MMLIPLKYFEIVLTLLLNLTRRKRCLLNRDRNWFGDFFFVIIFVKYSSQSEFRENFCPKSVSFLISMEKVPFGLIY